MHRLLIYHSSIALCSLLLTPCKSLEQGCEQAYKSSMCRHIKCHFNCTALFVFIMRDLFFVAVFLSFISLFAACKDNREPCPQVQSFEVDLSKSVPRMLDL